MAGLAIAGTILYESYVSAPDLADDIANGRSLTNRCVECQAMSLRVTTADYARAVRAWELTGERRETAPTSAN
ncbi:hypothetical protein KAM260_53170 (plasmid) [Klebsiella pneumoniae]|nr:hypothetical protein KAM260_53170 [Klebsiella pneumoniae]